ncbi:hypothetical protein [Roseibium sediminicola]|uniref:Uncharacterized protein n=1 Tax=Roseibium sediminicola TaxID=2933272 RepID=A0ABT0H499_9HYPH|nr:hypothetical protein [Roseibium sp. CAU 1639]MCK7615925.1 hypothetical protein [Roseibium sp. CAU 1639]
MNNGPVEIYRPRDAAFRAIWEIGVIKFKVYDLLAQGKTVTGEMLETADSFLREEVVRDVGKMDDNNGLGFVIIHPGDLGVTIAAQWWSQGSVLCQRIYRHQYDDVPLDTIRRPAVACVWELEIINAEQTIWRETMMKSHPDEFAYLNTLAA